MRGIWSHISSDEGMTLIEIMIASVILLIVLTALLPLVFQTTQMTSQTQAQTVVNNYVNSLIEEIRSLPYDQIGTIGSGDLPGSIEPTRSVTVEGGYTLDLVVDVSWRSLDDTTAPAAQDYKQVSISAEVSAPGKPGAKYSAVTYVWRDDAAGKGILPDVSIGGSALDASAVQGNSVLVTGAATTAREGGSIVRMAMKVDTNLLPDMASPPNFAEFKVVPDPANVSWQWDTGAEADLLDELGLPTGNVIRFSPDGYRVIKVEAWDDLGTYNYATRRVLVDNEPPYPTPSALIVPHSPREIRPVWGAAADGTDFAEAYNLRLYREPIVPADESSWAMVTKKVTGGATTTSFVAEPFSRYKVLIQSESMLGHKVDTDDAWVSSETTTTGPELTGSYTRVATKSGSTFKFTYDIDLVLSTPQFQSGPVKYEVWLSSSQAGPWTGSPRLVYEAAVDEVAMFSDQIADGIGYKNPDSAPSWYYRVRATFVPASDNRVQSAWSNVARAPGLAIDNKTGSSTVTAPLELTW